MTITIEVDLRALSGLLIALSVFAAVLPVVLDRWGQK